MRKREKKEKFGDVRQVSSIYWIKSTITSWFMVMLRLMWYTENEYYCDWLSYVKRKWTIVTNVQFFFNEKYEKNLLYALKFQEEHILDIKFLKQQLEEQ